MIPISGSAYTYGYATLGEFVAWIIGWDLILEYLFAASTVAVGWSGYVVSFLKDLGIVIPASLAGAPTTTSRPPDAGWNIWRLVHRRLGQHRRRPERPRHGHRGDHHRAPGPRHPRVGRTSTTSSWPSKSP